MDIVSSDMPLPFVSAAEPLFPQPANHYTAPRSHVIAGQALTPAYCITRGQPLAHVVHVLSRWIFC